MSFGESVFSAGFNEKTVKGDLHVKGKIRIPTRNQLQKVPEESGGLHAKVEAERLPSGATRPTRGPPISLVAMSVSHRLLGCI